MSITTHARDTFATLAANAMRDAYHCATEAIDLEQEGAHTSYDCAHWWLGAVLNEFRARILGYRGASLEQQLGRPPRPMPAYH